MGPPPITAQILEPKGMHQNAQPWLDCYPEPAKNLAEVADI